MHAVVVRTSPIKELVILSLFESLGGSAPGDIAEIELGWSKAAALAFKNALVLTRDDLVVLLGIGAEEVSCWPSHGRPDGIGGERLLRSARLFATALDVLGDGNAASRWLKSPQRALGYATPLWLARTESGARAVEAVMRGIPATARVPSSEWTMRQ